MVFVYISVNNLKSTTLVNKQHKNITICQIRWIKQELFKAGCDAYIYSPYNFSLHVIVTSYHRFNLATLLAILITVAADEKWAPSKK
jgi:hypothetical protein